MIPINFEVVKNIIPQRSEKTYKGSFGTLVSLCGSAGFAGAAVLSCKASLKCGVGIVNVAVPKCIYNIVSTNVPEAIFTLLSESGTGTLNGNCIIDLEKPLGKSSACLIGCGLGENADVEEVVNYILKNYNNPILLDADGINCINGNINVLASAKSQVVLTPHLGEMARMLNTGISEVINNAETLARNFSQKTGKILVLKGSKTIVVSPCGKMFVNNEENSGLAKGGSGDVLSGIIASFLAQGIKPLDAAVLGVYLHSESGKICAARLSKRAMLPSDVICALPELFLKF